MKTRFILMAFWCFAILFGASAQELRPYARLGVATTVAPDFFDGIGTEVEGGVHYKGIMASMAMTLWSNIPMSTDAQSIIISRDEDGPLSVADNVDPFYSGERNFSIMVQAGYDLLSLIPDNSRHHLTPFAGIGWSSLSAVIATRHQDHFYSEWEPTPFYSALAYSHLSKFDYTFGGRYEFSITDKWHVGLSYKYMHAADRHLMSLGVSRTF